MYFYKNVHGGGYQPTTTPLEIDSKREYSIFVTPTEVLNNPDVEFIVARKLPSSRSIFSTAAHGGPHCANISSLLQRISHSRDPPFSPAPFLLYLLFSFSFWIQARRALGPAALPGERRGGGAGEFCAPRRAAQRRHRGASGAASSAPRVSGAAAAARRRRWGSGAVGRRGGPATEVAARSGGSAASWWRGGGGAAAVGLFFSFFFIFFII